jgi:hypothetical protein
MSHYLKTRFTLQESRDTFAKECMIINEQQTDALLVGLTHWLILSY